MGKVKRIYVSLGKPLEFRKFDLCAAPLGWIRLASLKRRLKNEKEFRIKFTAEELIEINERMMK